MPTMRVRGGSAAHVPRRALPEGRSQAERPRGCLRSVRGHRTVICTEAPGGTWAGLTHGALCRASLSRDSSDKVLQTGTLAEDITVFGSRSPRSRCGQGGSPGEGPHCPPGGSQNSLVALDLQIHVCAQPQCLCLHMVPSARVCVCVRCPF